MRAPSSPYCRLDLAPPSADRFIFGVAPIDYGPVVLLVPFGFHLAMDTLPSEELTSFFGQRGITPAFGYGPPHPSARRTSTFLNNALLSTQYGAVRLLQSVRVRRVALRLRGPASFPCGPRRSRGLPVLVHVVSPRARVLRLRRTDCSLAFIAKQPCCLPPIRRESASWFCVFRSSIARPTDTPVYASSGISRCHLQD